MVYDWFTKLLQKFSSICFTVSFCLFSTAGGGLGIIPPPPGGVAPKIAPPPGSGASPAAGRRAVQPHTQAPFPSLDNFGASSTVQQQSQQQKTMPDWGDFTSASGCVSEQV